MAIGEIDDSLCGKLWWMKDREWPVQTTGHISNQLFGHWGKRMVEVTAWVDANELKIVEPALTKQDIKNAKGD